MSILVMGQFPTRGCSRVRRSHGASPYSLAVQWLWLEAESTRVEVEELSPGVRL